MRFRPDCYNHDEVISPNHTHHPPPPKPSQMTINAEKCHCFISKWLPLRAVQMVFDLRVFFLSFPVYPVLWILLCVLYPVYLHYYNLFEHVQCNGNCFSISQHVTPVTNTAYLLSTTCRPLALNLTLRCRFAGGLFRCADCSTTLTFQSVEWCRPFSITSIKAFLTILLVRSASTLL